MQDAAKEIKGEEEGMINTAVSVDGGWQKRGYSSFNRVVTAISMETGKILDVEPLTRICFGCKAAEAYKLSDPERYNAWKEKHACLKNHSGSARAMELPVQPEYSKDPSKRIVCVTVNIMEMVAAKALRRLSGRPVKL